MDQQCEKRSSRNANAKPGLDDDLRTSIGILAAPSVVSLGGPPATNNTLPDEKEQNNVTGFELGSKEKERDEGASSPVSEETFADVFVEGGVWGWSTAVGALLLQFTGFGYVNAFGVYEDFYVREYLPSYSSSQISWIGSTQIFLTMSLGLLVGRWFDHGYFIHMAIVGSLCIAISIFMLSLAKPDQYYQIFLSQGLLTGIGSGLTYVPTLSLMSHHFRSPGPRALAMGIVASGSSLGGLVHPIMLNNLFHGSQAIGFGRGVRASAGLVIGVEFLAILLIKTKYAEGRNIGKLWNLKGYGYVQQGVQESIVVLVSKFAKDWKYVNMLLGMMLYAQGLFFPIFYLQLLALEHGLDPTFSFYTIAMLNGSSVIGRLIPGFLAHHLKLGVLNMLIFCNYACAILIFAMLGVKTVGGVAAFAVLYGIFSGSLVSLLAPNLALLADHPSELGARIGISFAFTGIGSLIGNPINGALLTSSFMWWRPIIYSGVMCMIGSATFVVTKYLILQEREKISGGDNINRAA